MKLNLITLATIKSQLGISANTYDTEINAMLPIVSSDVRRILNYSFDEYLPATITSGSTNLTVSYSCGLLAVGQVVYHPDIPDDTYITSYDPLTGIYTLSANATDDGTYIYPTLTIGQWSAVSKMAWYKIQGQSTTDAMKQKLSSFSIGSVSKTYATSEINSKFNYPQVLIDDLGSRFIKI